jgi:SAM-dependent methyltransferase
MKNKYVHGYDQKENIRLQDQASTLVDLLHSDTSFPPDSKILEAGCGVGAQTVTLAKNSPNAHITSIDISEKSIAEAREKVQAEGYSNVTFQQGDIFNLSFSPESFDHIFVCFILEHLPNPVQALTVLKQCQVELQKRAGGNANIGRTLYPLLNEAGYKRIKVSPRMVYIDSSKPDFVEGFTKNTFTAMIEGIREKSLNEGIIDKTTFDKGIKDLYRTAQISNSARRWSILLYLLQSYCGERIKLPNNANEADVKKPGGLP